MNRPIAGDGGVLHQDTDAQSTPWQPISVLLAPALLLFVGFTLYPVLRTLYNSVHMLGEDHIGHFVGLANFINLINDDTVFWKAVRNTAFFSIFGTLADVAVGLLLATCLYAKVPLARVWRVIWFTPVLMSYVVVGIIWVWIYDYDWGVLNLVLHWIGLGEYEHSWLGDPSTALWALLVTQVWKWAGFNMIICLAALSSLPEDILGAAELDHCGWGAKLVYIIIPMLRPTLINLLVLSFIGKMMIFDVVWVMTGGGPLWSTETVSTYVYKRAFDWSTFDLGYPSAIAVLWSAMILAFVLLIARVVRKGDRLEF